MLGFKIPETSGADDSASREELLSVWKMSLDDTAPPAPPGHCDDPVTTFESVTNPTGSSQLFNKDTSTKSFNMAEQQQEDMNNDMPMYLCDTASASDAMDSISAAYASDAESTSDAESASEDDCASDCAESNLPSFESVSSNNESTTPTKLKTVKGKGRGRPKSDHRTIHEKNVDRRVPNSKKSKRENVTPSDYKKSRSGILKRSKAVTFKEPTECTCQPQYSSFHIHFSILPFSLVNLARFTTTPGHLKTRTSQRRRQRA